jgi:hypothetical protein
MNEVSMLACSTTRGRYALDRPDGPDLTAGFRMAVLLGGIWVAGTVEHGRVYSGEGGIERGYYFIADGGERCGLCVGMHVRAW